MQHPFSNALNGQKLQALDALRANVMLADTKLNITYMNASLLRLMQEAEAELKRELPRFSAATLIGSNIDVFHKNPSHQRNMLAVLDQPHSATIQVGARKFDLVVIPLKQGGKRTGFAVEWSDAKPRLLNVDFTSQIEAIGRTQSIIEFTVTGEIVNANKNFLDLMGYRLDEIKGKQHSIFMDPAERDTPEYVTFWKNLADGKYQAAEFRRLGKGGKEVYIAGAYNPIFDEHGKVTKIVKFATDVTGRVNSVAAIGQALSALAEGDLSQRVEQSLVPEVDQLRIDYNRARERLQDSLTKITGGTTAINRGTAEIRSAADDLSGRTERQAANLEETAAALDEITAAVKATSENAVRARSVVEAARKDAEDSAVVVTKAVGAMQAIAASSQQVSQIIGVIDEIAFQTNLLALNAGVEAARAGDAGRGFAVVASEVRALAQRSAEAAKEIKGLISTSAGQVKEGVELVTQTGTVLEKIVAQVSDITGAVATIAASALEQANGLQGVNKAVNEMDQVTQQNAAMVEETTAAARSLAGETAALSQQVGQFKLEASSGRRKAGFVKVMEPAQ
jgi:methyl-accepting chemotaxis protein